ncbi:alpha/beta-hydrolase family protein [Nocardioides sp. W7]|uniref:alpha/beta hydrolase n=1 Tax=Nocardioides sp. W7 TaxID=2931390 RepID=UPI001FD18381|nr:alpha/beta-hydrolase family protein [Nocardioides sp. W7]
MLRRAVRRLRCPIAPTTGAIVLFWLALTPSLLPRSPLFQGLVCGVAAALGYAVGALLGWLLRSCGLRLVGRVRRIAWWLVGLAAVVGSVICLVWYVRWEDDLRERVGTESVDPAHVPVLLGVGLVVFVLVVGIARLLRLVGRFVGRQVSRVLPQRVAAVIGALVVAAGCWVVVDDVVAARVLATMDSTFIAINDEFASDHPAPTSPSLSAGPASSVEWEDLGRQGRVFIANAPTAETIAAFTGRPALQPVRAYVGVGTDGEIDLREEAQRAVEELELTGGFERQVVNVVTGTGRGWVNENQARALEYMWDGDAATVSMQYSYLPSWMSFLVDGSRAQEAGRLLFDAVYARWLELPEDARPLLVVSGESLGTFGGEAAFSGAQDLAERTSGALFVGPTGNNRLWQQFTDERDRGTPEVLPVYGGGEIVRFGDQEEDWDRPDATWTGPRIGYLQHANDPITWWTWSLALHKPDWLDEPRGRDVSPKIRWIPVVTMLQLAADQMVANDVPQGQGHQFGQEPVRAWAKILPSPGWDDADTDRLAEEIASQQLDDVS